MFRLVYWYYSLTRELREHFIKIKRYVTKVTWNFRRLLWYLVGDVLSYTFTKELRTNIA